MMRGPLLAAALVLAAGTAFAQPDISVEPGAFDFGRIYQGERPSRRFLVTNRGDAPLTIRKVETDCGCTAAELPRPVIPPGGSAELAVTFLSDGYDGRIAKRVTLISDDPDTPVAQIPVTGEVVAELGFDRRVVYLAGLIPGERRVVTVSLVNGSERPFAILSAQTSPPALRLDLAPASVGTPLAVVPPGGTVPLTLTLTVPDLPTGATINGLLLLTTDNPRRGIMELVVTGFVNR
jgi:hypothetical protein